MIGVGGRNLIIGGGKAPGTALTKLLLHFNGSDGDTTTVDSSFSPKTMTAFGAAKLSATQVKFGSTSTRIVNDTINGNGWYTPMHGDFDFGTGDFTIDCWVRIQFVKTLNIFYMHYGSSGNDDCRFAVTGGTSFQFYYYVASSMKCNFSAVWNPTVNVWHHIAFVRSGNTPYFFLNGSSLAVTTYTAFDAGRPLTPNQELGIGDHRNYRGSFTGYIDELRVSKGIARWTANFTPPTSEYAAD